MPIKDLIPALYWTFMMSFPMLAILNKNAVLRISIIMALYPFALYRFKSSSYADDINQDTLLFAICITCGLSLFASFVSPRVYRAAIESYDNKTTKNTQGVYLGSLAVFLFIFIVHAIFNSASTLPSPGSVSSG